MQLKLEMGSYSISLDCPDTFKDLEAGMLHVETALRKLFERHGMIQSYDERMKELGHRPAGHNHVKGHLQSKGLAK